ncbi:hypothetical protein [Enhygromyxa salina]|uniref:hypothetical protein n=1 Tax=Enhygromyxa salina TaxID=215803 RepID=UPI000D03B3C6|nr:hypothetical protein [Enhygromyxa salina]
MRYVPLSKKDVRAQTSTEERPTRANKQGKLKRVSSAELTDELNALERKLASQGHSLRDNRTVVYHEHRPDRAKLDKQVQRVRESVQTKPARAPMTREQLRTKVRRSVKAPARRSVRAGSATNGFWASGSGPAAHTDFAWAPSIGETEIGAGYVEARASFSASLGGADPGLHGSAVIRAGGSVLNERFEVVRFDAKMDTSSDGTYAATLTATLVDGFQYDIYQKNGKQPISVAKAMHLFDVEPKFHTKLFIIGYPVDIDVIITPTINVDFDVQLGEGYLVGSLAPEIRVDAKLEAYFDAMLIQAGAGGSALLLQAAPDFHGAAFFGDNKGQATAQAYLSGQLSVQFLQGRLYAFIDTGWGRWTKRFETELWNYAGWAYNYPLFEWDSSGEP